MLVRFLPGALISAVMLASPASASVYNFTFDGSAYDIAGQFVTDATDAITSITGTVTATPPGVDGGTISGPLSGPSLVPGITSPQGWYYSNLYDGGGIFTGDDAKEKFAAGASFVQVWTGFIYEGPAIAKKICNGL